MPSAPRRLLPTVLAVPALLAGLLLVAPAASATPTPDPGRPLAGDIAAAQHQLDALNAKVDVAVERYDAAQLQLSAAQRRAASAQAQVAEATSELAALHGTLGTIAASAYRTGGMGADALTLLVTGSETDYLDRASAIDRLSAHQSDALRAVAISQKRLQERRASARDAVADATRIAKQVADTKAAIERDVAKAQRLVESLKARQAELIRIAEEKARQARLAAARAAAQRASRAQARAAEAARRAAAQAAADAAAAGAVTPSAPAPSYHGPSSGQASIAVRFAYDQLGKPYQWGGAGPDSYDCSGLTMRAWGAAGVALSHSAAAQYNEGRHVSRSEIRPGDLVFFGSPIHHVGIYIGNDNMISAPHTGDVVKIQYAFRSDYVGATRP